MGEVPASGRQELESIERALCEVHESLMGEFQVRLKTRPPHRDMGGTAELLKEAKQKYSELMVLARDVALCAETRLLAWYASSLYPGDSLLMANRHAAIVRSIEAVGLLAQSIDGELHEDISLFKALWNKQETLDARKSEIRSAGLVVQAAMHKLADGCRGTVDLTGSLLNNRNDALRLGLEVVDGKAVELRLLPTVAHALVQR
jgi:hypothetical protein